MLEKARVSCAPDYVLSRRCHLARVLPEDEALVAGFLDLACHHVRLLIVDTDPDHVVTAELLDDVREDHGKVDVLTSESIGESEISSLSPLMEGVGKLIVPHALG